ncbi:MAG: hypothetical protein FWE18_00500 [Alphaproteobacteria bacterium]|nr:hypothetical protein [Alphaproteobacteria bacterium]
MINNEVIEALEKFIYYFKHNENSEEYKLLPMCIHLYSFLGCSSKFLDISKLKHDNLSVEVRKYDDLKSIRKIVEAKIDKKGINNLRELRNDILHNYYLINDHYNKIDYDKIINIFLNFIYTIKRNLNKSVIIKNAIENIYLQDINEIENYQNGVRYNLAIAINSNKNQGVIEALLEKYDIFELAEIYDKSFLSITKQDKNYKIIELLNENEEFHDRFLEYTSNLLKDNYEIIIELYENSGFTELLNEILNINDVEDIKKIYDKAGYTNLWKNGDCDYDYECSECGFEARDYILGKIAYDISHLEYLEKEFRCIKCNEEFYLGSSSGVNEDDDYVSNECPRCYKLTNDGDYCEDCQGYIDKQ